MQLCWVVPDLQAAMAAWTASAGVGPFFFFESVPFEAPVHRGRPAQEVNITAAMAQAGDVQIELVCQHDDRPSVFRDMFPAGQAGFHHAALYCDDYDASLAAYTAAGAELAFSCMMMGSRTCWVDTTPTLGFMVELIEANPVADLVFAQFRAAADGWDGKDPVRVLG
ncbi:VOC family protein [Phenylobacterium sp. LjRoot219]